MEAILDRIQLTQQRYEQPKTQMTDKNHPNQPIGFVIRTNNFLKAKKKKKMVHHFTNT